MYSPQNITGDLERGEAITRQSGSLVASVWRDKTLVYLMSTNCQPNGDSTVQRRNRDGTVQQVSCPPSVAAYNRYMGGVDRGDQLRQYYRVRCKTRKAYRYIFWFLSDSCIVNAYILHKRFVPVTEMSTTEATVRTFRLRLAEGLIGQYCSRQRYCLPRPVRDAAQASLTPPVKRRRGETGSPHHRGTDCHFPIKGHRSRCVYCWNMRGHRRIETNIRCRQCGTALCATAQDPPLDGPSCFERYHTECL